MRKGPSGTTEIYTNGFLDVIKNYTAYIGVAPDNVLLRVTAGNVILSAIQTALNGIHTDLATTLAGKIDSTNTALAGIHTDLATTLAGKLDTVNTNLGIVNTSIGGLNTLITASNVSLASIDSRLITVANSTYLMEAHHKRQYERAFVSQGLLPSGSVNVVTLAQPATICGWFHSGSLVAAIYHFCQLLRDGVAAAGEFERPIDISFANALGYAAAGINPLGSRLLVIKTWNVPGLVFELYSCFNKSHCAASATVDAWNLDNVNASGVTVAVEYYLWTSTREIVLNLSEMPEEMPPFTDMLKRSYGVDGHRFGYIVKDDPDPVHPALKLILSMSEEAYADNFDAIISEVDKSGVSIASHESKKVISDII